VREAEEPDIRSKREKVADADDEEMDIEDDDEDEAGPSAPAISNSASCIFLLLHPIMEQFRVRLSV
jgi:hypothetical protein